MLGAFMAVLDIQITNASLSDILGSLGSTLDEGSWVSTSYLVAEIVVIPLTGWLSLVFSTRRYLLVNATLFLVFSVACACSCSFSSLIVFRALQGLTGGVLIPTAFNLVLKLLPKAKQPLGFALFGMTATFAPAIGPTIGGWLTENYGWGAIFYLNLVPGVLLLAAVAWGLEKGTDRICRSWLRGDWWGIASMALGLGSLIVFLEEGNRQGLAQFQFHRGRGDGRNGFTRVMDRCRTQGFESVRQPAFVEAPQLRFGGAHRDGVWRWYVRCHLFVADVPVSSAGLQCNKLERLLCGAECHSLS